MSKPLIPTWRLVALTLLCAQQLTSASLLHFDEFVLGNGYVDVPSGYANLQWQNFGIIGGSHRQTNSIYYVGMVSPQNVAFNKYGSPATISSVSPFNLISAYLTGGQQPVSVTVIGYTNDTQVYSGTFIVSNGAPTHAAFNYVGVTRVRFSTWSDRLFAMDNLVVTDVAAPTNPPPPINPPPPANPPTNLALVAFDDLNAGVDWIAVPSDYSTLQWQNFGVLNGSFHPLPRGYRVGMISSPNVAFNPSGNPSAIISTSAFNLISAHLASDAADTYGVTVRGFSGSTLVYSNVYVISNTASTEVTFNYFGVTRVQFEPPSSHIFALDNLIVSGIPGLTNTPPPPPNTATGIVDLGTITVSTPGHEYRTFPAFPPGSPSFTDRVVVDSLIDHNQSSGGGGTLPTVSVDWATNSQFRLTVAAPPGMKFLIVPPIGVPARFGGFLWWQSVRGGLSPAREATVSFTGLEGTPPDFAESDSVLSHFDGFFGWLDVDSTEITNTLAFTSMTLTGVGGPWYTGFGVTTFTPHNESDLHIYYSTSAASDPGPFAFIVPVSQPLPSPTVIVPPAVRVSVQPNGDMLITFNGVLQIADSPNGPFADVPGNPSGSYTVPNAGSGNQQFFRTRISY